MQNKYKLQIKIWTNQKDREMISYSCVDCGHRNEHYWFGRDTHFCTNCEKATEIKGFEK